MYLIGTAIVRWQRKKEHGKQKTSLHFQIQKPVKETKMTKSCRNKLAHALLNCTILMLLIATPANAEDGDLVETPVPVDCQGIDDQKIDLYQIKYESDSLHIPGFLIVPVATLSLIHI